MVAEAVQIIHSVVPISVNKHSQQLMVVEVMTKNGEKFNETIFPQMSKTMQILKNFANVPNDSGFFLIL